jgi:hypothetical protein
MLLWTAFTMGLVGSLHCIGMCGPIAVMIGGQSNQFVVSKVFIYNFGRIITYTLMGALVGIVGQGLHMADLQKGVSIFIGISLLLMAVTSFNFESHLVEIPLVNKLFFKIKSGLGMLLKKNSLQSYFGVGLLNGLLPCGLVYMGIVGALSTGDVPSAMLYMFLFGLGTLPVMALSTFAGKLANLRVRNMVRRIYPVFLLLFGVLFLMRGLNFDLPSDFLLWDNSNDIPRCH